MISAPDVSLLFKSMFLFYSKETVKELELIITITTGAVFYYLFFIFFKETHGSLNKKPKLLHCRGHYFDYTGSWFVPQFCKELFLIKTMHARAHCKKMRARYEEYFWSITYLSERCYSRLKMRSKSVTNVHKIIVV